MKRLLTHLLLIAVLFLAPTNVSAQVAEFEKFDDYSGVTYIYISKSMLSLAAKFGQTQIGHGVNIQPFLNKITSLQVITAQRSDVQQRFRADVQQIVEKGKYERMMQAQQDGTSTHIYYKAKAKKSDAVLLILNNTQNIQTVVVMAGQFTPNDLEELVKSTKEVKRTKKSK